jgi:hypothetical protein
MYIRQRDVVVGAVLVLYIVFFALSPPAAVRTILSHPVGVAAAFGVAVYTALYHSKPIGALLIVALLASMTRVTERFTITDDMRQTATRSLGRPATDAEILNDYLSVTNQRISMLRADGLKDDNLQLAGELGRRKHPRQPFAAPRLLPRSHKSGGGFFGDCWRVIPFPIIAR